jgi:hypothetical protein
MCPLPDDFSTVLFDRVHGGGRAYVPPLSPRAPVADEVLLIAAVGRAVFYVEAALGALRGAPLLYTGKGEDRNNDVAALRDGAEHTLGCALTELRDLVADIEAIPGREALAEDDAAAEREDA